MNKKIELGDLKDTPIPRVNIKDGIISISKEGLHELTDNQRRMIELHELSICRKQSLEKEKFSVCECGSEIIQDYCEECDYYY